MSKVQKAAARAAELMRQPPWIRTPLKRQTENFKIMYSRGHKTSQFYTEILTDPMHPRYPRVVSEFAARGRVGLWLTVISTMAFAEKRTVRSWGTRRVKAAFTEELAKRGLNAMGQPVGADGKRVPGALPRLVGTLNVVVARKALTARFEDVRREAGLVVEGLLAFGGGEDLSRKASYGRGKSGGGGPPPFPTPPPASSSSGGPPIRLMWGKNVAPKGRK